VFYLLQKTIGGTAMKKNMIAGCTASALLLLGHSSFAFADTTGTANTSTTSSVQATSSTSSTSTVEPAVLPGDYFYSIASCAEDVQLCVAQDNEEKAHLLNQYASEKIAEANALLQNGDGYLADQTIQQALADQTSAMDLRGTDSTSATTTGTTDTSTAGDTQIDAEVASNLQAIVNIINQIKDPQQKQQLIQKIQDELQTLLNQLTQDNYQVDITFNSDGEHEDDQFEDINVNDNNQDFSWSDSGNHDEHDHHGDNDNNDEGDN
jgi:hypothetical protein